MSLTPKKTISTFTLSQYGDMGLCEPFCSSASCEKSYGILGRRCIKNLHKLVSMTNLQVIVKPLPEKKYTFHITSAYGQICLKSLTLTDDEYDKELVLYLQDMFKEYIDILEQQANDWVESLIPYKKHNRYDFTYVKDRMTFCRDDKSDKYQYDRIGYVGYHMKEIPSPEVLIGLLLQGHVSFLIGHSCAYDDHRNYC